MSQRVILADFLQDLLFEFFSFDGHVTGLSGSGYLKAVIQKPAELALPVPRDKGLLATNRH
jgi:hypothetical protein